MNIFSPNNKSILPELQETPVRVDGNTLSSPAIDAETRQQLVRVRQELWTGSLKGLVGGIFLAIAVHKLIPTIPQLRGKLKVNRNTLVFSVITCGACCSYIGAVVHGKNAFAFSNIIELFRRNASTSSMIQHDNVSSLQSVQSSHDQSPSLSYQAQLQNNTQNILNNLDESFHRRAEAIKRAKERNRSNFTNDD